MPPSEVILTVVRWDGQHGDPVPLRLCDRSGVSEKHTAGHAPPAAGGHPVAYRLLGEAREGLAAADDAVLAGEERGERVLVVDLPRRLLDDVPHGRRVWPFVTARAATSLSPVDCG